MVKFGLMIPQGWRLDLPREKSPAEQFEVMIKIAEEIERLGFDSGFLYDHLITYPTVTTESCFECYTSLAAIAMRTTKLRLGQLVTCTSYRNPALVAKMAATLDVISGGRLEFGIGAGWYEQEYRAYGYHFDKPSTRIRQLREAVQIIRKMWTEESTTFQGKYFSVDGAINNPKPIQKPHPPIMIGGNGEKLTLKAVAEFADRSDLSAAVTLDECVRKFKIIDEHCLVLGRDPDTIERTLHREVYVARDGRAARSAALKSMPSGMSEEAFLKSRIIGNPSECATQFSDYVEQAGVRYFILRVPDAVKRESLRLLVGEVFPNVE